MLLKKYEIGIFEDLSSGHHLAYLEILVCYLFKIKKRPLLIISEDVKKSEQYKIFLKKHESKFDSRCFRASPSKNIMLRYFKFKKSIKYFDSKGVRRVLIPTGDHLVQMIGIAHLFGSRLSKEVELRSGLLRLGVAYPSRKLFLRMKHWLSFWLQGKAPVKKFYYDDYAVKQVLEKKGTSLTAIPDPLIAVCDKKIKSFKKVTRKKVPNVICFGSLGALDSRKGVDLLIEAFDKSNFGQDVRLLLAGKVFDLEILKKIKILKDRFGEKKVRHLNYFLKNHEYKKMLSEIDVVCLPYRRHIGPSGVFAQAAMANKIIITSNYGWLGWKGTEYNKCLLFKEGDVDDLVEKMKSCNKNIDALVMKVGNFKSNSPKSYSELICGF